MIDPVLNIHPDRLSSLLKIGMRLTAERDLDRLLRMIIEETTTVMNAERSSLFLINRDKDEMWAKIAEGVEVIEIRFPVGVGIAGTVGKTGEIINIPDAYQDARFNPDFDKKTGFQTRSILCVPMMNMNGGIIGAIQVLNKRTGPFDRDDEALLMALASPAAIAVENADLYKKLNELNSSLEKKVEERTAALVQANADLASLNRELELMSVTDSLTQVFNRRHFMERLKHEMMWLRTPRPHFSLFMIDIDHFKKVNDTYGHPGGDVVIAGVASNIKSCLRDGDLLARYGGEEFALIVIPVEREESMAFAERLRACIESSVFEHGGRPIKVTISIGVGLWQPELGNNLEDLIKRADDALYRAKEQGRNRVCTLAAG